MEWFIELSPIMQAFLAGIFTWMMTALGASIVLFIPGVNRKLLNTLQGFAAGIMIAASFWSLLTPALEFGEKSSSLSWIPAAIGFILGGLLIRSLDFIVPHSHPSSTQISHKKEGPENKLKDSTLLFLAMTLHNIPEGLALGVVFGSLNQNNSESAVLGAIGLAIGMGIQNIPEGAAVSLPLKADGNSSRKSFNLGQLSGIVEPIFAVIGAFAIVLVTPILPYALAIAAGAMIYVVVEDLIPSSQSGDNTDLATLALMIGFVFMMILDVSLG
ncbi:ZIP family metal transporter [Macrococcoides canis]|uniref:ZIP family metal transporter n=1 Tax=Macrococcoides canis TaxID=1855823 RepID=A0A4R6C8E4_9STAP|nr:ZIP family metal transporter [Macrococcus canis]MEE1106992.1 ZIP family metal transporter [Macrococcus canis]TDM18671.1 ZIP family metal transporter [Macrococcus canis]TDM23889.1 ZIP family metal transporter [Macrococcus canis]TDM29826.1 ZIP family metal transporter [Macrococcus canis]TDM35143.1 ZIP family metal transporter [Macrococcus canis]